MNDTPRDPKEAKRPASEKRRTGAPESPQSNETFKRRTDPPGQAGLANETRPGLGTRALEPAPCAEGAPEPRDENDEATGDDSVARRQRSSREPNDKPLPRDPQEQRPDTWAHEAERSTGVSGHSSGS